MPAWVEVEQMPARHDRHHVAAGIDARLLADARVLVAGAGALGNETLKNLALLGFGRLGVLDHDSVEAGNLCRSVLYRQSDVGLPKAKAAADRVKELNPRVRAEALALDLTTGLGAGSVAEYDLVLGCLDSIEARWRLNRLCRMAGVPLLDAGIDAAAPDLGSGTVAAGQIACFGARSGACYECSMTGSMWQRLQERRSCLLAGKPEPERLIATTAPLAAVMAGLLVQEALGQLHRRKHPAEPNPGALLSQGDRLLVRLSPYSMTVVHSREKVGCLAHPPAWDRFMDVRCDPSEMSAEVLLRHCGMAALELDWDLAASLACPACRRSVTVWRPLFTLDLQRLRCAGCGGVRQVELRSTVSRGSEGAQRSLAELGVPPRAWLAMAQQHGATLLCRLEDAGGQR